MVIRNAQSFLMKQGCKFISVVGLCWGGLIAQRILSLGKFIEKLVANNDGFPFATETKLI